MSADDMTTQETPRKHMACSGHAASDRTSLTAADVSAHTHDAHRSTLLDWLPTQRLSGTLGRLGAFGGLRPRLRRKEVARRGLQDPELLAQLREPGCPVCAPLHHQRRSYFFWLFNESYSNLGVLERFAASFGFCLTHGTRVAQYAAASIPLSYMYTHMTQHTRGLIAQEIAGKVRKSALVAPLPCPTCESFESTERRSAWFLAKLLQAPDTAACYGKPGLLCFPHLQFLAPHVTPMVLKHMLEMHLAAMSSAAQALLALQAACAATTATDALGAQQLIDAAMELIVSHGVDPAPLPPLDTQQDRKGLPDPLHDFVASLNRTDGCPVCLEVARAGREWAAWLDGAAAQDQNISDLLPTCPEHVATFVHIGGGRLALVVIRNALKATLERTYPAHRALLPKGLHGGVVDSIRLKLEAPRQRLAAALAILQRPWYCPVCERLATAERRAIELLFVLLEEQQHQAAFERGHGLCMQHFSRALARVPSQALRILLLRTQLVKLAYLEWELEEARRKGIWCGRPETRGAEQTAWQRALCRFSGSWVSCT